MTTTATASLLSGYKEVDAFGPDEEYDDDEEEEEVTYVTLDLGNIEPTLVPSSLTYRLIGLDTPTPFLQLSGTILKGQHDSLLGTELLFTDGKDPHDRTKKSVNYVAATEQRIRFREVRLQPKYTESKETAAAGEGDPAGLAAEPEPGPGQDMQMVDRVTGKVAPRARAPRTTQGHKRGGNKSKSKGKGEGNGKKRAVGGDGGEDEDEDEDGGGGDVPPDNGADHNARSSVDDL